MLDFVTIIFAGFSVVVVVFIIDLLLTTLDDTHLNVLEKDLVDVCNETQVWVAAQLIGTMAFTITYILCFKVIEVFNLIKAV